MSAKQAATYHGADIVTRLRVQAPYSDDGQAMVEAAEEIEKLRGGFAELSSAAREWEVESNRVDGYTNYAHSEMQRKHALQRVMILGDHAAKVNGIIAKATS